MCYLQSRAGSACRSRPRDRRGAGLVVLQLQRGSGPVQGRFPPTARGRVLRPVPPPAAGGDRGPGRARRRGGGGRPSGGAAGRVAPTPWRPRGHQAEHGAEQRGTPAPAGGGGGYVSELASSPGNTATSGTRAPSASEAVA